MPASHLDRPAEAAAERHELADLLETLDAAADLGGPGAAVVRERHG